MGLCERALSGAPGGGRVALQLRAAHLAPDTLRTVAAQLRTLTAARQVRLLVSADLELAAAIGADGVQLPERGPDPRTARARLGSGALCIASRHDLSGLRSAHAAGADAATLSPVFAVPGKAPPLGLDGFATIAAQSPLPLIALGGLSLDRVRDLRAAGAQAVAVIRAGFGADDPGAATAAWCAALESPPHRT